MIAKAEVLKLVEEKLNDKMFIVDITVSKSNAINIFIDSFEGMAIDQCISISRHVEHSLDRDEEDFELQVSSPGLTESFKVRQQYIKNAGREIEVLTADNIKLEGLLKETNDDGIVLETSTREKVEGHKKKQLIVKQHNLKYDEIKSAKAVILFK
ncbi:MAG: ribosome assembly cofactor RimP [Bacteroidota bacterium]